MTTAALARCSDLRRAFGRNLPPHGVLIVAPRDRPRIARLLRRLATTYRARGHAVTLRDA